jgi:hypothetical protein
LAFFNKQSLTKPIAIPYLYVSTMVQLNKYIASFLICIFSFYIVPKEFIHVLYGHEDTADHSSAPPSKAPLALGSRHIHCDLLNFETEVFYHGDISSTPSPQSMLLDYVVLPLQGAGTSSPAYISLRGPPNC